tara:strand:+ start:107239 stop:107739 length:501 start_codon:yes stop_codon:yes gene_type:complete
MKKILILSATSRSNLKLAKEIAAQAPTGVEVEIQILEDIDLPLYSPKVEADGVPAAALTLSESLKSVGAFILVAPEYNGSIPPVVNNAIAWISRCSKEWRASFNDKFAAVATMSGGGGQKVVQAMRSQLEHLGTTVHSRAIVCTSQKELNPESAKKIMADLTKWIS